MGVVELTNKHRGNFTRDDVRLLEELGRVIAPGMTSPIIHKQLKNMHAREEEMLKEAITMEKSRSLSPMMRDILINMRKTLESDRCSLFVTDYQGHLWTANLASDDYGKNIQIVIPDNIGIAGTVFQTAKTFNIPDAYAEPKFNQRVDKDTGYVSRTILASPIIHILTGKPIGVLQAINKIGGAYSFIDEQRIEHMCNILAAVLYNTDAIDELFVSSNLNERIYQALSIAIVLINSTGHCTKVNRDSADLFFLEQASQWIGKHISELFGTTNKTVYQMWMNCIETEEEQTAGRLEIFPFIGESEGDLRSVRIIPFCGEENIIGTVLTFSPVPSAEEEEDGKPTS